MPSVYLTRSFIDSLLRDVEFSRERRRWILRTLRNSALLVIDMQDFFLLPQGRGYIPSASEIVGTINSLIEAYTSIGLGVIYTRHMDVRGGVMERWWNGVMDDMLGLYSGLRIAGPIVEKNTYDAFLGTPLQSLLGDVDTVVITGVMTHLCCETTARAAFTRGYNVIVPVDATATKNADYHRCSVMAMAHGFAYPATAEEIIQALGDGNGA